MITLTRRLRQTLTAAVTITCAYCSMMGAVVAEEVKLKFAFFTGETDMVFLSTIKPFIEAVNQDGKGIVQIELFANGILGGRSLPQQAQLVLDGTADITFFVPGLTPGRFPDNGLLELPGLFSDLRSATMVLTRLVNQGKLRGFEEYYPIATLGAFPYSLYSRKPIRSLDDIRGKKFATTNATNVAVLRVLGASGIPIPISEMPEAIGRGTIDGALNLLGAIVDFGVARVTSHDYTLRFGINPLVVVMNRKKFESLSPQAQEIIRKYSGDWASEKFIQGYGAYQDKLAKMLADDPKRTVVAPSPADQAIANARFKEIIDEWTAKDIRNRELLDALRTELRKLQ